MALGDIVEVITPLAIYTRDQYNTDVFNNATDLFGTASVTVSLVTEKAKCSDRWAYQYRLPPNMSNPKYIVTEVYHNRANPVRIPFEITSDNAGEKVLLTDVDAAILVYTKRPASYSELPSHFLLPFTLKLAELMAFPMTRDEEIRSAIETRYMRALHSAIEKDANAHHADNDPPQETVRNSEW